MSQVKVESQALCPTKNVAERSTLGQSNLVLATQTRLVANGGCTKGKGRTKAPLFESDRSSIRKMNEQPPQGLHKHHNLRRLSC